MVTLSEVKAYLGITTTAYDTQLTALLASANSWASGVVGGDLTLGTKTARIRESMIEYINGIATFGLSYVNATAITEINGTDFSSKVAGTDYLINTNDTVSVKDLYLYTDNDFGAFDVEFTAGYESAPADYIAVVANIVAYEFGKENGKEVASEKLWPRAVTYADHEHKSAYDAFSDSLERYIPKHLLYF